MSDSSKAWLIGVLMAASAVGLGTTAYTQFLGGRKSIRDLQDARFLLNKRLDVTSNRLSDQADAIKGVIDLLKANQEELETLRNTVRVLSSGVRNQARK